MSQRRSHPVVESFWTLAATYLVGFLLDHVCGAILPPGPDLAWLPLLVLVAVPMALSRFWPRFRNLLITHEFMATLALVLALTVGGSTLVGVNPADYRGFTALLALGALSSLLCMVSHWRAKRGLDRVAFLLIHAALPVLLLGGAAKSIWKLEGQIPLHEGEASSQLHVTVAGEPTGRILELPVQVQLDDFQVEFYPRKVTLYLMAMGAEEPLLSLPCDQPGSASAHGVTIEVRGIRTKPMAPPGTDMKVAVELLDLAVDGQEVPFPLAIEMGGTSQPFPWGDSARLAELVYGARKLKNEDIDMDALPEVYQTHGVLFDISEAPKSFRSQLQLLAPDGTVLQKDEVRVNSPLIQDGWWFYQSGWDPADPNYSSISAVYDPGLPLTFLGLALLVLGTLLKVRQFIARRPS